MSFVKFGNMWMNTHEADRIFVTTNATLDSREHLVMGRGAALEAQKYVPDIAAVFGKMLTLHRKSYGKEDVPYGLLLDDQSKLGAFQVKDHWAHHAKPELIEYSTEMLRTHARIHEDKVFFLNFPGVGYGGLTVDDVIGYLQELPDNVWIWTKYKWQKEQAEKHFS